MLLRYIDANPVVAGLVKYAWLYPWGSAASYTRGAGPPWLERRHDGWELARIGLTRSLAGLTWDEIARATGSTRSTCHASCALHRRLLREDPDYLERVAGLASLALHLCHMLAGRGESG